MLCTAAESDAIQTASRHADRAPSLCAALPVLVQPKAPQQVPAAQPGAAQHIPNVLEVLLGISPASRL
jgi:hypothetical protein